MHTHVFLTLDNKDNALWNQSELGEACLEKSYGDAKGEAGRSLVVAVLTRILGAARWKMDGAPREANIVFGEGAKC